MEISAEQLFLECRRSYEDGRAEGRREVLCDVSPPPRGVESITGVPRMKPEPEIRYTYSSAVPVQVEYAANAFKVSYGAYDIQIRLERDESVLLSYWAHRKCVHQYSVPFEKFVPMFVEMLAANAPPVSE